MPKRPQLLSADVHRVRAAPCCRLAVHSLNAAKHRRCKCRNSGAHRIRQCAQPLPTDSQGKSRHGEVRGGGNMPQTTRQSCGNGWRGQSVGCRLFSRISAVFGGYSGIVAVWVGRAAFAAVKSTQNSPELPQMGPCSRHTAGGAAYGAHSGSYTQGWAVLAAFATCNS